MNAANEVAVNAFLDQRLGFLDIAAAVRETLETPDTAADELVGDDEDDALAGRRHRRQLS